MKNLLFNITYIPIGQRVLLSCSAEDVNGLVATEGGILVPEGESRKKNPIIEMTVVACGPECKQVKPGASVLFNHLNAGAQRDGDLEYRWTEEHHIISIVNKELKRAEPPQTKAVD